MLNKGVYTDKELSSLIGTEMKSQMLDSLNDILRTNKSERITKMIISLNELDNSNNLEDGRPSNVLFITEQNNDVITDGLETTVVLNI